MRDFIGSWRRVKISERSSPPTSSSSAFVLGLDWIDGKKGWACCRLGTDSSKEFHLSHLAAEEAPSSPGVEEAVCVVIDAPIGLPSEEGRVSVCRACDEGAKVWLGGLKSSVFGPPVQAELDEWRSVAKGPGGHARGLLPAIHYAERIRDAKGLTLESHPELVFTALLGRALPRAGSKKTLTGLLARGTLLQRQNLALRLHHLPATGSVSTDNYLDSMAMALVALAWKEHGGDLSVIRNSEGRPERLAAVSQDYLMALPGAGYSRPENGPITEEELFALASEFTLSSSEKDPL